MNSLNKIFITLMVSLFVNISTNAQIKPFEKEGKWGFKNKKGEVLVDPIYDKVVLFGQTAYKVYEGKLTGIVDRNGKLLLKPRKGGSLSWSKDGYDMLELGGIAGLLKKGEALLPFEFSEIEVLNNNQIMAMDGDTWQLYNNKGIPALKKKFEDFYKSVPECAVKQNGKWAFLTDKNKLNFPQGYQSVEPDEYLFEVVIFRVRKNNKEGVFTNLGEVIPCEQDSIILWRSEYGLIITKNNGKYGLWRSDPKKSLNFLKVSDCIYPVNENTHLEDLIYGSDGCRHIPLMVDKKVYFFDTNSLSISKEFYDSYNKEALDRDGVLELTKNGEKVIIKGNRNCN